MKYGSFTETDPRKIARRMVLRAIYRGDLIPLDYCENCFDEPIRKKRRPIEAHHHKGYEGENALDVQWLCASCHKLAHKDKAIWTDEHRANFNAAIEARRKGPNGWGKVS